MIDTNITKNRIFIVIAVLTLILILRSCFMQRTPTQNKREIPVIAGEVITKDMPIELVGVGMIEAYNSVAINAQIGGILHKVHFKAGAKVKKGDLLFTIEQEPFIVAVKEAQGNLDKQKALAENAAALYERYKKLIGKEYITEVQLDQAKAEADAARASVEMAQASLDKANLDLNYTTIYSPIDGKIGDVLVKIGNLVKANEINNPLATINQLQPIYANFTLPENSFYELQKQASKKKLFVRVFPKGDEQAVSIGMLTFIDNAIDRSTGTIRLKATLSNKEETFWPGQFIQATVELSSEKDATVVPDPAILSGQRGKYLYVIKDDMTVEPRDIVTKFSINNETVVESGVKVGERVVVDGQYNLSPGASVKIVEK